MKTKCKDHKGINYSSIKAMCDAYDVSPTVYLKRIERGWRVQYSLEGKQPYFTRNGVDYYSRKEVCDAFKIHPNSFRLKQKKGYSIDDIVDRISYRAEDHLGNKYRNETEMCENYGVKVSTYRARMRKGMSKEEALTV